jgi:hypothetical protein
MGFNPIPSYKVGQTGIWPQRHEATKLKNRIKEIAFVSLRLRG